MQDRVIEINETAARLARRLADEYADRTGQPRFVAGSIGPSGKLPSANDPELSNVSFDDLADTFREQAVGLIRGGVDVLLIETSQDILEVKAAITAFTKPSKRPGFICRSRRRSRWIPRVACCSAPTSTPRSPSSKVWASTSSV